MPSGSKAAPAMSPEKLAYMANQIAKFFAHEGEAKGAESVADHLRKFWDPRMRREIQAYAAQGGEALLPMARQAVAMLDGTKA